MDAMSCSDGWRALSSDLISFWFLPGRVAQPFSFSHWGCIAGMMVVISHDTKENDRRGYLFRNFEGLPPGRILPYAA